MAIESILSSYENGVWDDRFPSIYLSCEQEEAIDRDLFDRYHYVNSLNSRSGNTFTIDIFIKNKEDWIFKYGSDLLQQSILAGYECNDGYLQERIARDHPGFELNRLKYSKVDTPNQWCLDACLGYENAHCSSDFSYRHKGTINYDCGLLKLVGDLMPLFVACH